MTMIGVQKARAIEIFVDLLLVQLEAKTPVLPAFSFFGSLTSTLGLCERGDREAAPGGFPSPSPLPRWGEGAQRR